MKRRIALLACLLLAGNPAWAVTAIVAKESSKPNILFIISDDHGWGDYGFMGHPHIATPNLDRLADRAITFRRGYSVVPLCRPSLASIVTGLYPHQHGVTGNDPALPDKNVRASAQRQDPKYQKYYQAVIASFQKEPNMVRDLTQAGYLALQTGKWWEGDPIKTCGFTDAMTAGEGKGDRHGGAGLLIGRDGLRPIEDFLDKAGSKPWFIWYAPMLPHSPHTPPADLLDKYLKLAPSEPVARYWACVAWFDRTCGDLFSVLKAKGQTNTLVFYIADNGWLQDPKRRNGFAARSKLSPYEGGVRTPIMISWPGKLTPRMDEQHLASSIDLWPTLAALTGRKTPSNLPGINLADERALKRRTAIFGEQFAHDITDVNHPARSLESRFIIDQWHKLIVPSNVSKSGVQPELYDLREDPHELMNLAETQTARVKRMMRQLDRWWKP